MTRSLQIAVFLLGLTLIGCSGGNTPKGDGGKKEVAQAKQESPDKGGKAEGNGNKEPIPGAPKTQEGKVEFTLSSADIIKEYHADPKAAAAKYENKLVEVSGKVGSNVSTKSYFTFETVTGKSDGKDVATLVSAKGDPSQFGVISRLVEGQKVKVIGKVGEYTAPYFLEVKHCKVTPIDEAKLLTISASDLAKELDVDKEKTAAKYNGKPMVVSGKYLSHGNEPPDFVILEGTPKTKIKISSAAGIADELKNIKSGESIDVRAYFSDFRFLKDNCLSDGILLTKKK